MAKAIKIVFDEWDSYVAERDGATMFISFDDAVTRGKPPADLKHCARILVPIHKPNAAGGPVEPENEKLWAMEDKLCAKLKKHRVPCRLVGRLTYGGLREIVFQLHGWRSFRTPVGLWMGEHEDYEIDVFEHDGWDFFDEYIRPRLEDRLFMADRDVVDSLIESGSNPRKLHTLDYAFQGEAKGLKRLAKKLMKRGYKAAGDLDYDSGTIELSKRLKLDLELIVQESLENFQTAEKEGVEFVGWGAAVVS